ncbi:unnamed protein product, partial [Schistosoma mattheei]
MTSDKYYDSDEIPDLSPHHLVVYDEDQLEKDESKNNNMIELELAKLRIIRLEKEIELEKLRRAGCESSGQSDIGFRAKLNHLIQYCDEEARAAILHCTTLEPEIGYRQALKLLEETFGQKHVIARTFIDNLLNFPSIRRNQPDGLRRLSREMQACGLTLEQMNYVSDLNSSRTIETMVLKLPTHIQQEWLKEQPDIANTRYSLLVNRGSNSDNRDVGVLNGRISADYNATRISYVSASDDNAPLRSSSCLECLSNHSLDQCQKFKDKNVRERKEFVPRHKLCNVCLKANHVAKNCRSPRSCAAEGCGWRHHT